MKFAAEDSGQGGYYGYTVLYSLDEKPHKILELAMSENNSGACGAYELGPCYGWTTSFSFLDDGTIVTRKSGTDKPKKKIIKVDSKPIHYCFDGNEYKHCEIKKK